MNHRADASLSPEAFIKMANATRAMIQAVGRPKHAGHYCLSLQSDQPLGRGKIKVQQARFASLEGAHDFLTLHSVWVFPSPDPYEQAEIAALYHNIALSMLDSLNDQPQDLMSLNTLVKGLFCIQWAGKGQ